MQKKLKEVALRLFAIKGYENTTTREIGKEAGIAGASLYAHFKSKEDLFLQVLDDLCKRLQCEHKENINIIAENKVEDYRETLLKVFKSYILYFQQNEYELLFWERARLFPPLEIKNKFSINTLIYGKDVKQMYRDLFESGIRKKQIRKCPVDTLGLSYFNLIYGFFDSLILYKTQFSVEQLDEAFEIFWRGVKYDDADG